MTGNVEAGRFGTASAPFVRGQSQRFFCGVRELKVDRESAFGVLSRGFEVCGSGELGGRV